MPLALEFRGVVKCFRAGAGSCRATLAVLRGVDLAVESGEVVAVRGARGAGTSTLLLCAAGLLTPDAGTVAWFGNHGRAAAVEHAHYRAADGMANSCELARPYASRRRSLASRRCARVLLVDAPSGLDAPGRAWLARRRSLGDAVLLATHDAILSDREVDRIFRLQDGLLFAEQTAHARVAEREWRGAARIR